MTDVYPLPPPFSDDEILHLLQPRSDAPWRAGDRIAGNLGRAAMVLLPRTAIHSLVHRRQW